MSPNITVKEKKRDDELLITNKEIQFPDGKKIETPTKSFQAPASSRKYILDKASNMEINEISKRFDLKAIEDIFMSSRDVRKAITRKYVDDKINLLIPHLRLNQELDEKSLMGLSQFIYSVSQSTFVLPTIDFSYFKIWKDENKKQKIYDRNKIDSYINIIKNVVEEVDTIGNGKAYIGMIPLIPFPFISDLFNFYQDRGINSFIIDAGTKDILGASMFEFRIILSQINRNIVELSDSFIYATNLGYGLFEKEWTVADDFLSIYANVDTIGGTFKSRGFTSDPKKAYIPRAKIFSKEDYVYNLTSFKNAESLLEIPNLNRIKLRSYNENEQMVEAKTLREIIGEENMTRHLNQKNKIKDDQIKVSRLKQLATEV